MRRRVLFGSAAGAVGVAVIPVWMIAASQGDGDDSSERRYEPSETEMHIVAHPDDDLYFINPEVHLGLSSGRKVVAVYITGGEYNGRNGPDAKQADYSAYVAARYVGLRSAYAKMTVGDRDAKWKRSVLKFSNGIRAERATLHKASNVEMIFLGLWEDSSRQPGSEGKRLNDLWTGATKEHHTLVPTGSPLKDSYRYSRDKLLDNLVEVMDAVRPGVVRTLDPDPDPIKHGVNAPQWADQDGYSDHIDHTAAGLFVNEAINRWRATKSAPTALINEAYRGYYNRRWPKNLSGKAVGDKGTYLDIYAWVDGYKCGASTGCGDLNIGAQPIGNHDYGKSTYTRYMGNASWLRSNADGRLFASTTHADGTAQWMDGGGDDAGWTRSLVPHDALLMPASSLATAGADVWWEFAVTAKYAPKVADHRRRLLARSFAFGGAQGNTWHDLGNPEGDDARKGRLLGTPAAAGLPDGRVFVAVRDFRRKISLRIQDADGTWGDWQRIPGGDIIQDGICAVGLPDGSADIFGCAEEGFAHWRHTVDGGWTYELLKTGGPVATPTVVPLGRGNLALIGRHANNANVIAMLREKGTWVGPTDLGGHGGFGPVAAAAPSDWDGRIALAARNDSGTVSLAVLGADGERLTKTWHDSGPLLQRAPGLAVDGSGRLAVAVLGKDGDLHVARQTNAGIGLPTAWKSAKA